MVRGSPSQFTPNHPNKPTVGFSPGAPAPTLEQVHSYLDFSSYTSHERITMLLWELIIHVRQLEFDNHQLRAKGQQP